MKAMPLQHNKIKFNLIDTASNEPASSRHKIKIQHVLVSTEGE
jgi:hypothetical protein